MQVRVLCPGCRKKLAIPGHLAGKVLRCPSCQMAFRCPADTGAPPPAEAGPFDFTTPAAAGVEAQAPGQVQGLGWRLVRSGVGLVYLGLRLNLVGLCLLLAAGGVGAASLWLLSANAGEANAGVVACWIVGIGLALVGLILLGIGGVVAVVGQLLCCAVPQGVVSRLCIWGSVAALLAGFLLPAVGAVVTAVHSPGRPTVPATEQDQTKSAAPEHAEEGGKEVLAQVVEIALPVLAAAGVSGAVGGGTSLLSEVLWLLFLRQVTWLLGHRDLARGVVTYVVFALVWPLLLTCAGGITWLVVWATNTATAASLPWLVGVPSALVALLLAISYFWYFALVRRTALLLGEMVQTA